MKNLMKLLLLILVSNSLLSCTDSVRANQEAIYEESRAKSDAYGKELTKEWDKIHAEYRDKEDSLIKIREELKTSYENKIETLISSKEFSPDAKSSLTLTYKFIYEMEVSHVNDMRKLLRERKAEDMENIKFLVKSKYSK